MSLPLSSPTRSFGQRCAVAVIVASLLLARGTGPARAQPAPQSEPPSGGPGLDVDVEAAVEVEAATAVVEPPPAAPAAPVSAWTDQGLGAAAGVAFGGRTTPGGMRIAGTYLYRLSERDWFDGAASFTIGGRDAACFRDRDDDRQCDHGAVDGFAVDFALAVRRVWAPKQRFAPFARVGVALRFARFSGDELAGLAAPLLAGGGVLVDASPRVRIVAAGQLEVGGGGFARGVGAEPQLGIGLSLGFEAALR